MVKDKLVKCVQMSCIEWTTWKIRSKPATTRCYKWTERWPNTKRLCNNYRRNLKPSKMSKRWHNKILRTVRKTCEGITQLSKMKILVLQISTRRKPINMHHKLPIWIKWALVKFRRLIRIYSVRSTLMSSTNLTYLQHVVKKDWILNANSERNHLSSCIPSHTPT